MKSISDKMISILRSNRKLILRYDTYWYLTAYIDGYFAGIYTCQNNDIFSQFTSWIEQKTNHSFSVHYSQYILEYLANNNEDKAVEILLDYLEAFFNESDLQISAQSNLQFDFLGMKVQIDIGTSKMISLEHRRIYAAYKAGIQEHTYQKISGDRKLLMDMTQSEIENYFRLKSNVSAARRKDIELLIGRSVSKKEIPLTYNNTPVVFPQLIEANLINSALGIIFVHTMA